MVKQNTKTPYVHALVDPNKEDKLNGMVTVPEEYLWHLEEMAQTLVYMSLRPAGQEASSINMYYRSKRWQDRCTELIGVMEKLGYFERDFTCSEDSFEYINACLQLAADWGLYRFYSVLNAKAKDQGWDWRVLHTPLSPEGKRVYAYYNRLLFFRLIDEDDEGKLHFHFAFHPMPD